MKVLFAYKYLTLGGVETVLRARLEGLAAHGVEAHAWFLHDLGGAPLFTDLRDRVQVGDVPACGAFLRAGRFDLLCSIDTEEVHGEVTAASGPRLVVECHSPYLENLGYLRRLDPAVTRRVLVPSLHQACVVDERTGGRIPVEVVPNPLRAAFLAEPQPFPAPARRPIVAWIGRMDALKNWRGFVALIAALRELGAGCEAWMAGKPLGPAEELWKASAAAGIAGDLRWFRDLPHARVPAFLDAVRDSGGVLVSTSRGESFGMTIAEAMARRCAVLVPAESPLTELVHDGEDGLTFPPGQTAVAAARARLLLADSGLRDRLGHEARGRVAQRFTPEVALPRLAAALRGAAG